MALIGSSCSGCVTQVKFSIKTVEPTEQWGYILEQNMCKWNVNHEKEHDEIDCFKTQLIFGTVNDTEAKQ